jgi:thioredoxin reductase (NADPH)
VGPLSTERRDLLIVGAGPAGLATAIAAAQNGLRYEVLEKGSLVNSIFHFPRQMVFFTTAELLEIGGLPFVTPYEKPTRAEALRYYRRVADAYDLRIAFDEKVVGIARGRDRFTVRTERADAPPRAWQADRVVIATGYYDHPNRLGIPGEDLAHVAHYYDDPHPSYRKHVVVVGAKNSAAIAALELYRAGAASVTLVHRGHEISPAVKYWIRPDIQNRIKEGSIAALFGTCVREITPTHARVEGPRGPRELPADQVFLLTGYTPDVDLMRAAGVRVDPVTLKPEHDAQTFETNVPGLHLAGALVSGKDTGRVFIENGRFHGEAIVNAIVAGAGLSPRSRPGARRAPRRAR